MTQTIFITGTSTSVGKTRVGVALIRGLKDRGLKVGVMKPVETGVCRIMKEGEDEECYSDDASLLKEAAGSKDPLRLINPYCFSRALAPLIAANAEGVTIDLKKIKECYIKLSMDEDITVIEGAGGLLVPLTEDQTMLDLIIYLKAPIVIVAENTLGTINHTLLTVRHAEDKGVKVLGVILNSTTKASDESTPLNKAALEAYGVRIIEEVAFTGGDLSLKPATINYLLF